MKLGHLTLFNLIIWFNFAFAEYDFISPIGVNPFISQMTSVDSQTGFYIDLEGLYRSTDGGGTWDKVLIYQELNGISTSHSGGVFVYGNNGFIGISDDLGLTWSQIHHNFNQNIYDLVVGPMGRIWIRGNSNFIWRSDSSFSQFHKVESLGDNQSYPLIQFDSHGQGFVIARTHEDEFHLFTTIDSARTWQNSKTWVEGGMSSFKLFNDSILTFKNQDGWQKYNMIKDSTESWSLMNTSHYYVEIFDQGAFSISGTSIFRHSNSTSPASSEVIFQENISKLFYAFNTYWAIDAKGIHYKSQDQGLTWETSNDEFRDNLKSCDFLNDEYGFASGEGGVIWKTLDGGHNWTSTTISPDTTFFGIDVVDSNYAWVVGGPQGSVFKTSDGGSNWVRQQPITLGNTNLSSVHFFDSLTGYVAGYNGWDGPPFHKTYDGGLTWDTVKVPLSNSDHISDIDFLDSLHGVFSSHSGHIGITYDGGVSWDIHYNISNEIMAQVDLHPNGTIFATNSYSYLYKSLDSGKTWDTLSTSGIGSHGNYNGLEFKSATEGWIGTERGGIYYTSNGGLSWEIKYAMGNLKGLTLSPSNTLYACGHDGRVVRSIQAHESNTRSTLDDWTSLLGGLREVTINSSAYFIIYHSRTIISLPMNTSKVNILSTDGRIIKSVNISEGVLDTDNLNLTHGIYLFKVSEIKN